MCAPRRVRAYSTLAERGLCSAKALLDAKQFEGCSSIRSLSEPRECLASPLKASRGTHPPKGRPDG